MSFHEPQSCVGGMYLCITCCAMHDYVGLAVINIMKTATSSLHANVWCFRTRVHHASMRRRATHDHERRHGE